MKRPFVLPLAVAVMVSLSGFAFAGEVKKEEKGMAAPMAPAASAVPMASTSEKQEMKKAEKRAGKKAAKGGKKAGKKSIKKAGKKAAKKVER